MKDQGSAKKLVLRHLPPALSEAALRAQIESRFSGRYNWFSFRPAQTSLRHGHSQRHQLFSRAYIQMKTPQDVFEFADMFNGHLFVDEKGTQCKSTVEYAPYQGVPDTSKKDLREGTIDKDPKYLEFLEMIAKPTENLPSAEIQLERKEAERAGAPKEDIVVTPLMQFVLQKRAAKSGLRLSSSSRKAGGRARGASAASIALGNKRGIERGKLSNVTYVLRDTARSSNNKDKSTYLLVQQREQQQCRDNDILTEKNKKDVTDGKDRHNSSECTDILEEEVGTSMKNMQDPKEETASGGDGSGEAGKRRLLLSKDREKEFGNGPAGGLSLPNNMDVGVQVHRRQTSNFKGSSVQQTGGSLHPQAVMSPGKGTSGTTTFKQSQRWDSSGRVGRGVLLTKDIQLSVTSPNLEQQNQVSLDKRPPRHPGLRSGLKDHCSAMVSCSSSVDVDTKNFQDEKNMHATLKDSHGPITMAERQDRRTRNKDRPDRPVWTPRRRSDGPSVSDASQPSSESVVSTKFQSFPEGSSKIVKIEKSSTSRQKMGFVEKAVEETFQQGNNTSDSSVVVSGKSLYTDLSPQTTEIIMSSGGGDVDSQGNSRTILVSGENGNHKQLLRRPSAPVTREADGASILGESKPVKRGAAVGYGGQEKQVWVAVHK